jgi:hypothetical protein
VIAALRRVDPDAVHLRAAVVAMAAVLAAWGSALAVERAADQTLSLVVLAVVLAMTLERTQRTIDARGRLVAVVVLPLLAAVATGVGRLLVTHPDAGDALFVVAVSGAIWIRRFGPGARRAGTLVALPFIALLATPALGGPTGADPALWSAVIALLALGWVTLAQLTARRTGFFVPPQPPAAPPPLAPPAAAGPPAAGPLAPVPSVRRLPPSTRMALQMAVALGGAFALGRWWFPEHWGWVVLTAYIVCAGNRGRGDVLHKSGLRIAGAAAGTIAATLVSDPLPAGSAWSVVVIFVLLGLAVWLRPVSYAFWAAGVTAVLALLYGYFGQGGAELLGQRLLAVAVGAALGVAASWLVLPVRSHDVLRRRVADVHGALRDLLRAVRDREPAAIVHHAHRFRVAAVELELIAPVLVLERRLSRVHRRRRPSGPRGADAVVAVRAAREPVRALAERAARAAAPAQPADPAAAPTSAAPPADRDARSDVAQLRMLLDLLTELLRAERARADQRSRRRPQRNASRRHGSRSDDT